MQKIGYSLVDDAGKEVDAWGDVIGQCPACPDHVRLPNGDTVHGLAPGAQLYEIERTLEREEQPAIAPTPTLEATEEDEGHPGDPGQPYSPPVYAYHNGRGFKFVERWGTYGDKASIEFDGERVVKTEVVTAEMVAAERERRKGLGYLHDFGDARGVHMFGTTPNDFKGWDDVTKLAQTAVLVGVPSTPIDIVTNTGHVRVTAIEWLQIVLAVGAAHQKLWAASFALQGLSPVPVDYADDKHWAP